MKMYHRLMLALTFILVTALSSFAQRGGDRPSPEEMAKRQTERMTESLELSEEQAAQIATINLKYAKEAQEKRAAMRQQEEKDREAMQTARKEMRAAHNAELKTVLTDLQYAKLEGMQEARGERGRKRGGKKGKKDDKG